MVSSPSETFSPDGSGGRVIVNSRTAITRLQTQGHDSAHHSFRKMTQNTWSAEIAARQLATLDRKLKVVTAEFSGSVKDLGWVWRRVSEAESPRSSFWKCWRFVNGDSRFGSRFEQAAICSVPSGWRRGTGAVCKVAVVVKGVNFRDGGSEGLQLNKHKGEDLLW